MSIIENAFFNTLIVSNYLYIQKISVKKLLINIMSINYLFKYFIGKMGNTSNDNGEIALFTI